MAGRPKCKIHNYQGKYRKSIHIIILKLWDHPDGTKITDKELMMNNRRNGNNRRNKRNGTDLTNPQGERVIHRLETQTRRSCSPVFCKLLWFGMPMILLLFWEASANGNPFSAPGIPGSLTVQMPANATNNAAPDATTDAASDATAHAASDATAHAASDATANVASDATVNATSNATANVVSGVTANAASGVTPAAAPEQRLPSYRVTGFMQQTFTYEQDSDAPAAFSIHRARVGVAGRVTDRISVNIVAGALEPLGRNPQLVNGFVDFDVHPMLRIRTGQFLVPFGLEGPEAIFMNPAIERSLTIRRMNMFRMFRDVGVQFSGSQEGFTYAIAIINGTGANVAERIDMKDLIGRFGYHAGEFLSLGFSFHVGRVPLPATEPDRYGLGADMTYRRDDVLLRGEYIARKEEQTTGGDRNQHGGYLLAGYTLNGSWQPILRYEMHMPDTSHDFSDTGLSILTVGLNYYFQRQNRVSVNYEFRNDRRSGHASVVPGNLLTVQMQVVL